MAWILGSNMTQLIKQYISRQVLFGHQICRTCSRLGQAGQEYFVSHALAKTNVYLVHVCDSYIHTC